MELDSKSLEQWINQVRRWQTFFDVSPFWSELPRPDVVAEEIQTSLHYRMDGCLRSTENGGQLSITLGGHGVLQVGEQQFPLSPGRAFLHCHRNPDISYYYPADGTEPWHFLWIAFDGEASETLINKINSEYGYLFSVALDSPLISRLQSFQYLRNTIHLLSPLEAASMVMELLQMLCAQCEKRPQTSPQASLIRQTQALIASAPGMYYEVSVLAQRLEVSREHLSRLFREKTGITLQNYITDKRMRQAMELLQQTRLTGKEIADHCGYADYSSFYRAFRRYFNTTPEQVRKFKPWPE